MTKKTIEETYQMMSHHEHILKRPDMYIGSVNNKKDLAWVFKKDKIKQKEVEYVPGFLKIVDEAITNSMDHSQRHSDVTTIKVDVSSETGEISVMNNGPGIPVVLHSEHNIYVPEMIFGNLLTGSNYDDTEQRTCAGMHGLGIKLTSIFSKSFKIETVDSSVGKKYIQTFTENMTIKSKPKITDCSQKSYTKVTFLPDYEKFNMEGLDKSTFSLLKRRVYECIACTNKNVSIYFNGEKLKGKGLLDYASYFTESVPLAHEINGDWEYLVYQNQGYEQVSFVNGNHTSGGGKHVDFIVNQIVSGMKEKLEKKLKDQNVKANTIKDNLFIFVKCVIVNPKFTSQTKDVLSTPIKDFGNQIKVSEAFINKIYKSGITQEILEVVAFKNRKLLDKNVSVVKKSRISVKNLDDATNAGTSKSSQTTLLLTEGLSASSFAISGLSVVGRANYGVFALRGKLLNIREATQSQLLKNEEIIALKKIMGLSSSKTYETKEEIASLRYGSIGLLTDSDHDGIHIASLIMNFIHFWWPALMKIKGFIKTIRTPIVKLKSGNVVKKFYNEIDYKAFMETSNTKWVSKYYKGLGTSTALEAKETFKELAVNTEIYIDDKNVNKSFNLAFNKKQANDRKTWLKKIPDDHAPRNERNEITYSDFINKELIHFSVYDNIRSIPNIMDGLKPSQRKVLYTAFKRNLKKEIKVAQFGASVAEETAYHHGEVSLSMTIIGMAQDYPGSNNINLLEPCGNFGYRNHNGKDAASPRYIFTHLTKSAQDLFIKEDEQILEYNEDDGVKIEPKFYVPTLPMVLINGVIGIGTGYSTNIPSYNPDDIRKNIHLLLNGKEMIDLVPWVKGFKGTITRSTETSFIMKGLLSKSRDNVLVVDEIPTNISISDYKDFLETFEEFSVKNESTENTPKFTLVFKNVEDVKKFNHTTLKLTSKINTSNMHLFTVSGELKKYDNPNEIIREFVKCKLEYLQKRKLNLIKGYKETLLFLKNKKRFLECIINESINVYKKTKMEIERSLVANKFDKIKESFSYLTSLPISSFTSENLDELEKSIKKYEELYKIDYNKSPVDFFKLDLNK